MTDTAFSPTKSQKPASSISYSDYSDSVKLEVTNGDCKVRILSTEGEYGDITINYVLEDDREGTASIKPVYYYNNAFLEMTDAGGDSDGKLTLATSEEGTDHVFIWDTVVDLGIDYKGKVQIKIIAYDRDNLIGDIMETVLYNISVDNAPEAPVITSPVDGYFDKNTTPVIVGTIPDPKAGNSNLHFKIEIATEDTFTTIEKTFESVLDQTGWEYYNGAAWVAIPETGVPIVSDPTLIGESFRLTIQTEYKLAEGQKYIRAYAGGIES